MSQSRVGMDSEDSSGYIFPDASTDLAAKPLTEEGRRSADKEGNTKPTNVSPGQSWTEQVQGKIKTALPPAGTNALATSAFATYVLSLVGYGVYLLHGLLPAETVRSTLMISCFPSQVWATILPAWLTVAFWYLFLAYFATNLSYTPPIDGPDGLASITDHAALILNPPPTSPPLTSPQTPPSYDQPVPILRDLPCQVVNQFYFK